MLNYKKNSLLRFSGFTANLVKTLGVITALFFSVYLVAAPNSARVESLTFKQNTGKLRVTFELSKSVKYKAFILKSPDRVVIDFKNTSAAKRIFKFKQNSKNSPIAGIRYAVQNNKNLRVVLDMDKTVGLMSRLKRVKSGTRVELVLSNTSIGKNGKKQKRVEKDSSRKTAKKDTRKGNAKAVYSKALPKGDFVVVIDAGHGGKDPGAIGLNGVFEKTVVLQIAKRLKQKIDSYPGMRAVMTRASDSFVSLKKRVDIASANNPDLFISVHANANIRRSMSGSSVYILSRRGASSAAARFIAARENASHGHAQTLGSIDFSKRNRMIKTVLLDLTKTSTINRSLALAKNVLRELGAVNNLHRGRVESAAFVVLKSLDTPSMLVETAYISNPKEEIQLSQKSYQNDLANAIFNGVKGYYRQHSPKSRRFASSGGKYKVRSGDTLLGIARRHKVTLSQLKRANNLSNNTIRAGQKLKIPSR